VPDVIYGAVEKKELGDILLDETEIPVAGQMVNVRHAAGDKIINADDFVAALEQQVGEVRTKKSGGTGDNGRGFVSIFFSSVINLKIVARLRA